MSSYEYIDEDRDLLRIVGVRDAKNVYIAVSPYAQVAHSVRVDFADVPTVALELLKAAGRAELAGMIEAVEADRTARAEREAAEKKLQERRDAVLKETGMHLSYDSLGPNAAMRKAVDRIIALGDELDGASRD